MHLKKIVAIAALALPASAQSISLATDSLPSQQGWALAPTGLHSSATEADLFTPGSDVVEFNTMDQPIAFAPGSYHARYDFDPASVSDDPEQIFIDARVRVLDSQVLQFNFGFRMAAAAGGMGMSLGLGTNLISYSDLSSTVFDATDWHDYSLVGDLQAGTYDLFVDGQFIATKSMFATTGIFGELGDGTGTGNARVEIESFVVTVPAPASVALLAIAGLLTHRRR